MEPTPAPRGLKPILVSIGVVLALSSLGLFAKDCERSYIAVSIGLFVLGLSATAMGLALQKTVGKTLFIFATTALVGFGVGFLAFYASLHLLCRV